MGWPDMRGLNETNRSREQQLVIGEMFREEVSPSCPAWYLWAPGAGPRQKGENHAEAWPPASTRRTLGRYPFHTTSPRSNQGEWIHSPSDVGTEPIHFHQECTA